MSYTKQYVPLFYMKDSLETNEWIRSDFRVARYFFTLEEAIQYVNDSNADAVKVLIDKGYSVGYSVVSPDKLDESVEYSIITHAHIEGCCLQHDIIYKYEIVCKEDGLL